MRLLEFEHEAFAEMAGRHYRHTCRGLRWRRVRCPAGWCKTDCDRRAAEKVFAIAGNMKRFNEWSPWGSIPMPPTHSRPGGQKRQAVLAVVEPRCRFGVADHMDFVENRRIGTALDFGSMGKAMSLELAPVNGSTGVTWGSSRNSTASP
jgi:hypothetical protein